MAGRMTMAARPAAAHEAGKKTTHGFIEHQGAGPARAKKLSVSTGALAGREPDLRLMSGLRVVINLGWYMGKCIKRLPIFIEKLRNDDGVDMLTQRPLKVKGLLQTGR